MTNHRYFSCNLLLTWDLDGSNSNLHKPGGSSSRPLSWLKNPDILIDNFRHSLEGTGR